MTRRSVSVFGLVVLYTFLSPPLLLVSARIFPMLASPVPWVTIIAGIGDIIVVLLALRASAISLSSIGWTPQALGRAVVWTAMAWCLGGAVLGLLVLIKPGYAVRMTSLRSIMVYYLFVGLPEELLFRGYLFTWLHRFFQSKAAGRWAALWAALSSSLLFALYHIPQRLLVLRMTWNVALLTDLAMEFFSGLFAAWLFLRSENVWWVGLWHGGGDAPLLSLGGPHDAVTGVGMSVVYLILTEVMRNRALRNRKGKSIWLQKGVDDE